MPNSHTSAMLHNYVFLCFFNYLIYNYYGSLASHVDAKIRNPSHSSIVFPDELDNVRENLRHDGHDPEFHRIHGIPLPGNRHKPRIPVEDPIEKEEDEEEGRSESREIPLSFIQNLNNASLTVNDFLLRYVTGVDEETDGALISDRFAGGDEDAASERNGAFTPKPAHCQPELQTVSVAPEDTSFAFYFPSCIRIERCGGCCNDRLNRISCQPTESEMVPYKIIRTTYDEKGLIYSTKKAVFIEKHTKCRCQCIVKKESCTIHQEYNKGLCRCVCSDMGARKACMEQRKLKTWDSTTCSCVCRPRDCTSGSSLDGDCNCVEIKQSNGEIMNNNYFMN